MPKLMRNEIHAQLRDMPGWEYTDEAIRKEYSAPSFHRAIALVVQIGMLADVADHHPDLDIRYSRVIVALSTHSEGGVTAKDIELARKIDQAFGGH